LEARNEGPIISGTDVGHPPRLDFKDFICSVIPGDDTLQPWPILVLIIGHDELGVCDGRLDVMKTWPRKKEPGGPFKPGFGLSGAVPPPTVSPL
jgi:hypothetical protein